MHKLDRLEIQLGEVLSIATQFPASDSSVPSAVQETVRVEDGSNCLDICRVLDIGNDRKQGSFSLV